MDRLIVVSGDSHATVPPDAWPRYLEAGYLDHLPEMHEDDARYTELLGLFANFSPELLSVIDTEGVWASGGYLGAWDADRRLAEMDREGIAAELVFQGDPRAISPLSPQFRKYPQDVAAAGVRAYHRWAADAFGEARDRILIVGDPASAVDIDAMLAELQWIADHGFVGAYVPGYWARPDLPPVYDPYFDPYWSRCVELGLPVAIHAGYGQKQCEFLSNIEGLQREMEAAGRTDLLAEIINNAPRFFQKDLRPRRAMWQLMFVGRLRPSPAAQVADDRGARRLVAGDPATSRRGVRTGARRRARPAQAERVLAGALPDDLCRSCTRPKWPCAMSSASRRSSSGVTSRTRRERGPTRATG